MQECLCKMGQMEPGRKQIEPSGSIQRQIPSASQQLLTDLVEDGRDQPQAGSLIGKDAHHARSHGLGLEADGIAVSSLRMLLRRCVQVFYPFRLQFRVQDHPDQFWQNIQTLCL